MFNNIRQIFFFLLLTFIISDSCVYAENQLDPIQTEITFSKTKAKPGDTLNASLTFKIKDGWHIYSENPGDVGLPTKFNLVSGQGLSAGQIAWPRAKTYQQDANITYNGYEGSVTLNLPLVVSSNLESAAKTEIELLAKWAACSKDLCIPGRKTFKQEIEIVK